MKNKMMRVMSKLTATAMVLSLFSAALPIKAVGFDWIKDTMSRQKISETSTHDISFLANASIADWVNTETITLDYATAGFNFTDATVACSITGTGTCSGDIATEVITLTCTAANCQGTVTVGQFSGTNPGTTGSKSIAIGGTSEYGPDTYLVQIVDDDQVTINAQIDSTMTFDLDTTISTSSASHEDSAPYDVAFGTLDDATVASSNDTTINSIWVDLTHNATGGAVVTVQSSNNGLASISVPADEIVSTSGNYSAGAENYGLCIDETWATSGTFAHFDAFGNASTAGTSDNTDCEAGVHNNVGQFTGSSPQNLLTSPGTLFEGTALLRVKASISSITPAHPDYADTLTFVATSTF